jgi:circadian clock protein KaiC
MSVITTADAGDGPALTGQGMEEHVYDCVILLDHRVAEHMTARRMRVVKYRGSTHGTNEYPFLIGRDGLSVVPVTSLGLQHEATTERVSTGLERLDTMLGGRGYYRGSSVLVSGTAGTGKTSIAASFAAAASARGEKCLYFAFEESQSQITRNMRSIGIDLEQWTRKGLLTFQTQRPTDFGLELHLASIFKSVKDAKPLVVVIDPITNFFAIGSQTEIRSMLTRLIDYLKSHQITTLFTSLTPGGGAVDLPEVGISSLIDTWLLVREVESNGERNRLLHVLKSRGMPHSNQVREFVITSHGIDLLDVYVGPSGVLTGSARVALEAREEAERRTGQSEAARQRVASERRQKALEAQISALQADLESERQEMTRSRTDESLRSEAAVAVRDAMAKRRSADVPPEHGGVNARGRNNNQPKGGRRAR